MKTFLVTLLFLVILNAQTEMNEFEFNAVRYSNCDI